MFHMHTFLLSFLGCAEYDVLSILFDFIIIMRLLNYITLIVSRGIYVFIYTDLTDNVGCLDMHVYIFSDTLSNYNVHLFAL